MTAPSAPIPDHVDENGAPCARHAAISQVSLYQLALLGSRAAAFHHDCASKLQGLVMALDELTDLTNLTENADPRVVRALEAAIEASRELSELLNINRALARPAGRTSVALRELVAYSAGRVGVAVHGTLPEVKVGVGVAPVTHALALAIDAAAGTGRARSLAVSAELAEGGVELALHSSPLQAPNAGDSLAIATFVIARECGRLWCSAAGDRLKILLPPG
ncbi:MAG TPA: hypothetical protein VF469_32180 [Kofleriaceae bacterium]